MRVAHFLSLRIFPAQYHGSMSIRANRVTAVILVAGGPILLPSAMGKRRVKERAFGRLPSPHCFACTVGHT
jgi:hypothetical protein